MAFGDMHNGRVLFHVLLFSAVQLLLITPSQSAVCKEGEFRCSSGLQCVNAWYVCDGDVDCLDSSDEIDCRAEMIADGCSLMVADMVRKNIYQVGINGGEMVSVLPFSLDQPIAVLYDQATNDIYWTDVVKRTINRYSLVDSTTYTVHKAATATAELDGLALDGARHTLYYCDAGDLGGIGTMSTDGSRHRVLLQQAGMKPRSIVLDLTSRKMYWTDWGSEPAINVASMETDGRYTSLIEDNLGWPNALAIDFTERTMYWGDAQSGTIEAARLDGKKRRILFYGKGTHFFGMQLTPRYIYYTDWNKRSVQRMNRRTNTVSELEPTVFGQLAGITYCCLDNLPASARKARQHGHTTASSTISSSSSTTDDDGVKRTHTKKPSAPATRKPAAAAANTYDYHYDDGVESVVVPDNSTSVIYRYRRRKVEL